MCISSPNIKNSFIARISEIQRLLWPFQWWRSNKTHEIRITCSGIPRITGSMLIRQLLRELLLGHKHSHGQSTISVPSVTQVTRGYPWPRSLSKQNRFNQQNYLLTWTSIDQCRLRMTQPNTEVRQALTNLWQFALYPRNRSCNCYHCHAPLQYAMSLTR